MASRRDILKNVVLSGTASAFLTRTLQIDDLEKYAKPGNINNAAALSNSLTNFVLLDDIVSLAMTSKLIPAYTSGYVYADFTTELPGNISRMGWMVPGSKEQVNIVMRQAEEQSKSIWQKTTGDALSARRSEILEEKLAIEAKVALMLGWYMSAGIRDLLAPAWDSLSDQPESAIYQDVYILTQIANSTEPKSEYEIADLLKQMTSRMLTRIHTFKPDEEDAANWTVRISKWRNEAELRNIEFSKAFANSSTDKINRYVVDTNFYDPNDAIIKAARYHRRADLTTMSNPGSLYGQAIIQGLLGLIEGSKVLLS